MDNLEEKKCEELINVISYLHNSSIKRCSSIIEKDERLKEINDSVTTGTYSKEQFVEVMRLIRGRAEEKARFDILKEVEDFYFKRCAEIAGIKELA